MPRTPAELKADAKAARDAARAAEQDKAQHDSDLVSARSEAHTLINTTVKALVEEVMDGSEDMVALLQALNPDETPANAKRLLKDAAGAATSAIVQVINNRYG